MITRSMLNAAVKHLSIGILILSPSVLHACDSALSYQHSPDQREAVNKPTTQLSSNTNDSPHDPVTDGYIQGATARAWQAFARGGKYRWAGQSDFRFPDWAKEKYRSDIERAMKTPIGWSSGDTLGVSEYGDDGSYSHCFIKWNAKMRSYLCNLKEFKLR